MFLLDTNALSTLVRDPQGKVAAHIAAVGESNICTSIIVAAELRYGAAKRASARLARQLDLILKAMEIIPFESPMDRVYAELRNALEKRGRPIGGNDLIIAAQALALEATLVTDNVKEFEQVPGLNLENWVR
ncbi:MAG TPA: type II toxin-antitoxin system VapC family toxin [Dongiaceae bacterium]